MSSTVSHSDLLANRNSSAPLGPFDGSAAAIIQGYVYTTPNQDRIWLPPMQQREVYLRSDFRYGPHDPTLWPQPYIVEYPHLGAILTKPEDSDDPLSIMWWNPTRDDFEPSGNGVLDGLGGLCRSKYEKFEVIMMNIQERMFEHHKKSPGPLNPLLVSLARAMDHACTRIGSLKSAYGQMRFGVTEFQRYYLELHALLDYLEVYKPRMDGLQPMAKTVAKCIGVFTNTPRVVQDFHAAGLPVWFIRPREPGPFPHNVLNVVSPLDHADRLCLSQYDPPFPVIFRGSMNTPEKHNAIHRYSRTWLVFKDPFQDEPSAMDPQPSRNTARGTSSSKPQTLPSGGRDKFSPLTGPLSLFPIPAWSAALQAVDRSSSNLVETSKSSKHFGHYVFPDPGLFVTPTSDEKKARLIESWLRAREAWLMRIETESSLAMSGQNWRDFLAVDLSNSLDTKDTKAERRCRQVFDIVKPKSTLSLEVKTRSTSGEPLVWRGKNFLPGVLPSDDIIREILWELYELNFSNEILSLDRRACTNLDILDDLQLIDRQAMISQCFTVKVFKYIPIPLRNQGLAATDIKERLPYVLALVRVMGSWKGNKPEIFSLSTCSPDELSDSRATELEDAAAKYYCQQFYNYFGRAAQVPHRLFPTTVNLARFL